MGDSFKFLVDLPMWSLVDQQDETKKSVSWLYPTFLVLFLFQSSSQFTLTRATMSAILCTVCHCISRSTVTSSFNLDASLARMHIFTGWKKYVLSSHYGWVDFFYYNTLSNTNENFLFFLPIFTRMHPLGHWTAIAQEAYLVGLNNFVCIKTHLGCPCHSLSWYYG